MPRAGKVSHWNSTAQRILTQNILALFLISENGRFSALQIPLGSYLTTPHVSSSQTLAVTLLLAFADGRSEVSADWHLSC